MKPKVIKVFKIILIAIVAICVIILIKKIINKEEIPFITNNNAYVVLSGSMDPTINIGDIVISKKANKDSINTGDIVTFTSGSMMVTHRIVEVTEDENGNTRYITKGDNNNTNDMGSIEYENIVGKYSTKIPKLGYLVLFIQKYLLLVILFFVFIIVYISTSKRKEK